MSLSARAKGGSDALEMGKGSGSRKVAEEEEEVAMLYQYPSREGGAGGATAVELRRTERPLRLHLSKVAYEDSP